MHAILLDLVCGKSVLYTLIARFWFVLYEVRVVLYCIVFKDDIGFAGMGVTRCHEVMNALGMYGVMFGLSGWYGTKRDK